ncbi:NAD(P)H-hydrate epimerase [Bacilliculturomica massiliensis]|uniref:NAD(P)H-hydrate epimerase n=1 Tax=Bacilliculturomica massiliensis TaxID=1917867 RepID=UPI0010314AC6|nr:NAD(P)H-hydrate epimerase [Bacilliculturomica massiliensis]
MKTDQIKVVTCAEMKAIERAANEGSLSYYQMMENAGTAAAGVIAAGCPECPGSAEPEERDGMPHVSGTQIVIFCGKGNNGGDGYVAARRLYQAGAEVTVLTAEGPAGTEDAMKNAELVRALNISVFDPAACPEPLSHLLSQADIIVDAIYGTGFHGELAGSVRRFTEEINRQKSRALIYALDIPSGLSGDSGQAAEGAVRAHRTIVFHRLKPVHVKPEAGEYCGEITTVGIGID